MPDSLASSADAYEPLSVNNISVEYNRQIADDRTGAASIQSRWFANDPWELLSNRISSAIPAGLDRTIAQSFRLQAEDYFHAATTGRELAVKPVLLYYAFLNLAKSYAISVNRSGLAGRVYHGIHCDLNRASIMDTQITLGVGGSQISAFRTLLELLGGDIAGLANPLRLGDVIPQILPGHRLWCHAANQRERFLSIDWFRLFHSPNTKKIWVVLDLTRNNFLQMGLSEQEVLSRANLEEFEIEVSRADFPELRVRQRNRISYSNDPQEALYKTVRNLRNDIWETVRSVSPYRKYYIFCSPQAERNSRMPQLSSIYLIMFVLSYATRYDPEFFENLLDSEYGPFFSTFISESPMQFLYLLSSEIVGREISKPAII